jgi:hypothetical protein
MVAPELRAQRDDVLGKGRALLEAERHVGDPSAVVLGPGKIRHRHANVGEEDLAEVALALDGPHRPDPDAGLVHVEDEPADRCHLMTFSRGTTWGLQLAVDHPAPVASIAIGDYLAAETALPDDFAQVQLATRFRGRPMEERISRHVLEQVAADSKDRYGQQSARPKVATRLRIPLGMPRRSWPEAPDRFRGAPLDRGHVARSMLSSLLDSLVTVCAI